MRLLHVVPSYRPAWRYGGPIRSVHGLCKGLHRLGHEVHVFTTNVDGPGTLDVPLATPVDVDGVKVWYFASPCLRRTYWSPCMGRALAAQVAGFDLLHLHSVFLWPTTKAATVARRRKVPYVIAPRGMLVPQLIQRKSRWLKTAWIALFERRNIAHASLVHFTSGRERDEAMLLELQYPGTCVVPNGVEDEDLDAPQEKSGRLIDKTVRDGPFLLFVGRVSWEKGLDRLIATLALAPAVSLIIAGSDDGNYARTLAALAVQNGVEKRVRFIGSVKTNEKKILMQQAAALILPSYSENFGNVVLEAMAMSCPVIVTPEVGAAEILRETGAGFVLAGDAGVLGPGIAQLLAEPDKLREAGRLGREAVARSYTWLSIARRMEAAYHRANAPAD